MVRNCAAPGCPVGNLPKNPPGITVHKFPTDEPRRSHWISLINRSPDFQPTHNHSLCSMHFRPEDFREASVITNTKAKKRKKKKGDNAENVVEDEVKEEAEDVKEPVLGRKLQRRRLLPTAVPSFFRQDEYKDLMVAYADEAAGRPENLAKRMRHHFYADSFFTLDELHQRLALVLPNNKDWPDDENLQIQREEKEFLFYKVDPSRERLLRIAYSMRVNQDMDMMLQCHDELLSPSLVEELTGQPDAKVNRTSQIGKVLLFLQGYWEGRVGAEAVEAAANQAARQAEEDRDREERERERERERAYHVGEANDVAS